MKFLAIILGTALYLKVSGVVLAEIDFNKDIKPILSENCYYCHGLRRCCYWYGECHD